ncbi:Transmembrane protein, partial [Trema orientale]
LIPNNFFKLNQSNLSSPIAMETSQSPPTLSLIFSQTYRTLKSQPRHFFTLSCLFLLPPSVAATIYPIFSKSFLTPISYNSQPSTIPTKTLLFTLSYVLFASFFTLSAVGSITYSVIRASHGQPLNLQSAIKSIPTSFFRLLATNLLAYVIVFVITFVFTFVFASLIIGATLSGYRIEYYSPYFLLLCFAVVIVLSLILTFLQVNWALSSVVVVAETTWGLASLKRSWNLIKGKRWLVFFLFMCFGFPLSALSWIATRLVSPSLVSDHEGISTSDEFKWYLTFPLAVQVLIFSTLRTLILLSETAAFTVLYVYFNKAFDVVHGDEEFAPGNKYVSLAVHDDDDHDDEKVSSYYV